MSGCRRVGSSTGNSLCTIFDRLPSQFDDHLRQLEDRELVRVAEIDRPDEIVRAVHHPQHAFDKIVAVAERAGLAAVAEHGDVLAAERLADEVRHDAAVERMHPRPVGVEDPHHAHVQPVHPMVIHEQRLGRPLAFVVTGPRPDRVHRAAIRFGLRMHLRVAVHFAGRGLQDFRPATLGDPQRVDRPQDRSLHRLDRVVLVMAGGGRAGQVVNLVHLENDRLRHVVPHEIEIRPAQQVGDVRLLAGEEIVQADHVVTLLDQPLAQVRTEKPGTAGDQNALNLGHRVPRL